MPEKLLITLVNRTKGRKCSYCGKKIKVGETYRYRGYYTHKEPFCLKCKPFLKGNEPKRRKIT